MAPRARHPGVRYATNGPGVEIRFQHRGVPYSRTLDLPQSPSGLRQAARAREQWLAEVRAGVATEPSRGEETFAEVAQGFLDDFDGKRSTRNSYRDLLNAYWIPGLGHLSFAAISYPLLRRIDRSTPWRSPKTRKNAISALRTLFSYGVDDGLRSDNPAAQFRVRKIQRSKPDPYTRDEIAALLAHMDRHATMTGAMFARIAFSTGMRTGEILGLRWEDFDPRERTLHVRRAIVRQEVETVKTDEARIIHIGTDIAQRLLEHPTRFRREWVLLTQHARRYRSGHHLRAEFVEAHEAVGLRLHAGPYPWRHTFACQGLAAGIEPGELARHLGHSLETFWRVYADWIRKDSARDDADRFEQHMTTTERGIEDGTNARI